MSYFDEFEKSQGPIEKLGSVTILHKSAIDWLSKNEKIEPSGWYLFYSLYFKNGNSMGGRYVLLQKTND